MIGYFYRHPGSTLRELVAHTGRDKGQLARTIKELKEQGLLESTPDPDDRRSQRLTLTDEGRRIHETFIGKFQQLAQAAIKGLSEEERTQLHCLLCRVQENLTNESRD